MRGYCLFAVHRLLLLQSTGFRHRSFSSCYTQAQKLWLMGLVAPKHGESTQTRGQTCVPSINRWILNYWATRKVLNILIYFKSMILSKTVEPYILVPSLVPYFLLYKTAL